MGILKLLLILFLFLVPNLSWATCAIEAAVDSGSAEQARELNRYATADWIASKFQPNANKTLCAIKVYLKANSETVFPANATLYIYSHDAGENDPNALHDSGDCTSAPVDVSTLGLTTTDWTAYTFTGMSCPVTSGTNYWVVINTDASNNGQQAQIWSDTSTSWSSDMELRSDDDGSGTWTFLSDLRCFRQTFYEEGETGSGTLNDPYLYASFLSSATCGNTIYLKDGTYSTGTVATLAQTCGSANPLIFKCSNGTIESKGSCLFSDAGLLVTGSYITIDGFKFTSTVAQPSLIPFEINGTGANHNTVTDCRFYDIYTQEGVTIGRSTINNQYNRFTRNLFEETGALGWRGYGLRIRQSATATGNTYNTIDRNVFLNHDGSSLYETIQMGDQTNYESSNYNRIEHNLIQGCTSDGAELISVKNSNNYINYNTVINSKGAITLRMSNNTEVIGNIFLNSTSDASYSFTGIRVYGTGHKVLNNYLQGYASACDGADYSFMGITLGWGDITELAVMAYPPPIDILVANNTLKDTCRGFTITKGEEGDHTYTAPVNVTYLNNLGESQDLGAFKLFCGTVGDATACSAATGITWTSNRGHTTSAGKLKDASISVTDSGDYELVNQKTGLSANWYYPSTYTNGTYNANVTLDIQRQGRSNPPDIGCDESGGSDVLISVGPTWTGGYTIQGREYQSLTLGTGSLSITGGGSLSLTW